MRARLLGLLIIIVVISFLIYAFQSSQEKFESIEDYRIGILISGPERLEKIRGLKEGLQDLGLIEGLNVNFVLKDANSSLKQMNYYAQELDQMDLDVIIAGGAIETKYLKENKNGTTPIVFLGVADAINLNLVDSYQKPNGRITGVENAHVELSRKRLQLFKMLIPILERVIVVYDENIDASLLSLERVEDVAKELAIDIYPISIKNQQQLNQFMSLELEEDDGILVLPSYYLEEISPELGQYALANRLPIFGVNLNDIKNGFLLSYGVSYYDQGFQGATMTSRILNGLDPGGIPVEKPNSVELLVNPKTERILNIEFSKAGNAFINRVEQTE